MVTVLGAGIAGISAAYHLQKLGIQCIVFERRDRWGGLCDNFTIGNDFRFDYFVHLSFSANKYVKDLFASSTDYQIHVPNPYNYYKGAWLKHPLQNNLAGLPVHEKVKIITDFVYKKRSKSFHSYNDWLISQFGKYFTDVFTGIYTEKYWTIPASELTTDWIGDRFSLPQLEQLLRGAFEEQTENHFYAQEMRYPREGGYKSFLKGMATEIEIETNKNVLLIDIQMKKIEFEDGSFAYYDELISSLPLPELVMKIKDVPKRILEASANLLYTSGQLVSLGLNRPDIPKYLWFYIYDSDIIPSRAYSPSLKSQDNVPIGKSSLQFEIHYSSKSPKKISGGALIEHVVHKGEIMKLWSLNDIEASDYREVQYANVVFDFKRKRNLKIIHEFLFKNHINYIGRFGEWDYLWSDQSLLSGKNCAEKLLHYK